MQSRFILRSILALAIAAPFAVHATPLGTRAGEWEGTVTTTSTGMSHAIPKEQLAKMPPERRQQVEAMLKSREGQPQTMPTHGCIKASDSVESMMNSDKNSRCTRKIVKQTSNSAEVVIVCHTADGKVAFKGTVHFKAESSTHVVSTMEMKNSNGVKTVAKSDSRWKSATCSAPQGGNS